jgi:A/G-specific adenine glycosylase
MQRALVAWYRRVRRDLPWRQTRDAYAIWISEVMLQQTRVETVVPYWERFVAAFPDVGALAEAPLDRVLEMWSGLGYYRRARLLHRGAGDVARDHASIVPRDPKTLARVSGIGRYTAGAIASIAYGVRAPLVDGNVARVLSRFDAREEDPASPRGSRALWERAEALVATSDAPGDWNQALMELGALVCTPKNPSCDVCPIARDCAARVRGIERTLPRIAPKKKPKRVHVRAFVIELSRGKIVMAKRPEYGLYAGLWEPPMIERARRARVPFGLKISAFEPKGHVEHVLTHRVLSIDVYYMQSRIALKMAAIDDYETARAVTRRELASLAKSTLARRVLAKAFGHDLDLRRL